MNSIYTKFSIKDLENLTGIKAHTIRVWEKRYGILKPDRTGANIRHYDIQELQRLLNVALLYHDGEKISRIAQLTGEELNEAISQKSLDGNSYSPFLNAFKLSMIRFDQRLFDETYDRLLARISFRQVFTDVFIPLLFNIGLEWQSNSITPAHEHFISCLIKQKLLVNMEQARQFPRKEGKVFVLYLPMNEVHELGLLYIHYELTLKGYHSIYLGQSVPNDSLKVLQNLYGDVRFISYFTIHPAKENVMDYLKVFEEEVLQSGNSSLWVLGRQVKDLIFPSDSKKMKMFQNMGELIREIH